MSKLIAEVWSSNDSGTLWHNEYWEDDGKYFSTHMWQAPQDYPSLTAMLKEYRSDYREAKTLADKFTKVGKRLAPTTAPRKGVNYETK